MKHVATIAGRELRGLFLSPIAYGVLALFSVLAGLFFILNLAWFNDLVMRLQQFQAFDRLEEMNLNDDLIREFYGSMSVVLLFLVPGITMGLFAAEKTNGTQELLLTSPLTIWDIVLGKFLAGVEFVTILTAIAGFFPALLFIYGNPELGKTLAGMLCLWLVSVTYVAVGVFASSVTRNQLIAFIFTFVLLLILDEPTVGLDPLQIREIRSLIAGLAAPPAGEEQHTVILSTHILAEVEAICRRVILISNGRKVVDAPLAELTQGGRSLDELFARKTARDVEDAGLAE